MGTLGCSWRRSALSHAIYGDQLLSLGWNDTSVRAVVVRSCVATQGLTEIGFCAQVDHWPLHRHGPNTTQEVLANLPIFQAAWATLDHQALARCCGC
jgi:hypothetical protein